MLNHKLILRNIFRIKNFPLLNIISLSIGFACTFAVIIWLKDELSYDKHLPDSDRIYRLTFETQYAGISSHFARCWEPFVWKMADEFPQIEELVRLAPLRHTAVKTGENRFYTDRIFATDTNFFKVFNTDLLAGNSETALKDPYSAVISLSIARKFFGNKDPLGQTLLLSGEQDTVMTNYTVKGIMSDSPLNSHVHFDVVTSFVKPAEAPSWAYVYLLLAKGSDPAALLAKIPDFIKRSTDESDKTEYRPYIQRITDIHLFSDKDREIEPNGNVRAVFLFIAIALVLLLVSWINYHNLSKAKMYELRKQISIQSIHGASGYNIVLQSLAGSAINVLLSLVLLWLIIGSYELAGQEFTSSSLTFYLARIPEIWSLVIFVSVVSAFIGSMPVINHVLRAEKSMKETVHGNAGDTRIFSSYGILMISQFCLSVILIVASVIITRQKDYMFSVGLGGTRSDIFVFRNQNWEIRSHYNTFREKALQNPLIKDVTASMEEPSGETLDALLVESSALEDKNSERRFYVLPVEDNFLTFFNMPLVAGRNFSQYNQERKGEDYILNETAVRNLGWTPEEAIGKPFKINFDSPGIFYGGTITGVVKDFCFNTANQEIKPYVLFQKPIFYLSFLVKIDSSQKNEALSGLRKIWDEVYPDYPFEYESVEDLYKSAYKKEVAQAELTSLFSILAVVIICFGLISFTSVTVARRTKEIGIRKVNGAKLPDILMLLNANLIKRNIIAFSVACPVSWLVMDKWLQSYVYKTTVEWWIFLLAGISVLLITIATTTIRCWHAAVRNPVETLKYE